MSENPFERLMAAVTMLAGATVVRPLTPEQKGMLEQDLPYDEVRKLKDKKDRDGNPVEYVDGHYIVDQLNQVFGYDGWWDTYGTPVVREGERPVIYVTCTLTAAGVTRQDTGVGIAANDKPDSFETALKAAYTDGLKRAARKLGARFGLALYDKDRANRAVGFSFAAQSIVQAFEAAVDQTAYKAVGDRMRAEWASLKQDEREAIVVAHKAASERLGGQTTTQTSTPDSLAPYRLRINACATTEILAATCFELAATLLPEQRAEAWSFVVARAVALGASEEAITRACAHNATITKEPQAWGVVTTVLRGFRDAATKAGVNAIVKTHGAAVSKLPEALKAALNAARKNRLDEVGGLAVQIEEEIRRASTIPELDAIHDKITNAVKANQLAADDAARLVGQYNAAAASLEQAA